MLIFHLAQRSKQEDIIMFSLQKAYTRRHFHLVLLRVVPHANHLRRGKLMKLPATAEALASAFHRHSILQSQGNCRRHCHRNSHLKEESESPSYRRQYGASQQPLYFTPSILTCLAGSPVRGKTGKYLSEKSCNKMRSTCPPLNFAVCSSPSTQA